MADAAAPGRIVAGIPNLLSCLRLALAGAFPFLPESLRGSTIAVAGVSDVLDGWIARRFHATTHLGRLLDGIADKAFVLSAVVTLAVTGFVPGWEGLAVLARDVVVASLAGWCAARGRWEAFRRMRPRPLGKATTLAAILWLLFLAIPGTDPVRRPLFALAALASVSAAIDYAIQFARWRREAPSPAPPPPSA